MTSQLTAPSGVRRDVGVESSADADPLAWVSRILWPDGAARLVVDDRPELEHHPGQRWWASPSTARPQLLVPADSIGAARRAVRRYHDGFSLRRWAKSAAAEAAMSSQGLADRMLGGQTVVVDGPADATQRGVLGGLHELFGRDQLRFAISVAAPKTNRKPVIQVLDDAGLVLGWAKVAWNPWTEELVANEARWLSRAAERPLVIPSLVADTVLAGRRVVVSGGVTPGRRPRLRRRTQPLTSVVRAIAELEPAGRASIEESGWWTSVARLLEVADRDERRSIDRVLAKADGRLFSLGAWHGDFTPWNVMTVGGAAQVIDWEFAAGGVPLGFDVCHFHTQVASEMRGLSADDALAYSARHSPQGLAGLGVEPRNQLATWNLYLVELIRRTLALRAAGLDTAGVHQGRAAVRRLTGPKHTNRRN